MPLKIGALEVPNLSDTKVQLTRKVWLGGHVCSLASTSATALSPWVRTSPGRPDNRVLGHLAGRSPAPGEARRGRMRAPRSGFSTTSPATLTWSPRQ